MPREAVGWAPDAAGHPNPDALAANGVPFVAQYVGTAYQHYGVSRGYIDACHDRGVGVVLIFEEWSSQFLTGYGGAVASCERMMAGWDALGAPRDGSVIPHVALVDPTPSAVYGAEGALQDYARGWDDALPFPTWRPYGSKYGLDIARQVTRKMLNNWGVGTWGFGEAGNGWLPAWTSDAADMIQHGNIGAPIPGTDYNTLFVASMGAWGGPSAPVPEPPPPKEEDVMYIAVGDQAFLGRIAFTVDGGLRVGEPFTGAQGGYGIPQSAIDWNGAGGRDLRYVFLDGPRFEEVFKTLADVTKPPDGGGGGTVPVEDITLVGDREFIAEYDRRVKVGAIAAQVVDT